MPLLACACLNVRISVASTTSDAESEEETQRPPPHVMAVVPASRVATATLAGVTVQLAALAEEKRVRTPGAESGGDGDWHLINCRNCDCKAAARVPEASGGGPTIVVSGELEEFASVAAAEEAARARAAASQTAEEAGRPKDNGGDSAGAAADGDGDGQHFSEAFHMILPSSAPPASRYGNALVTHRDPPHVRAAVAPLKRQVRKYCEFEERAMQARIDAFVEEQEALLRRREDGAFADLRTLLERLRLVGGSEAAATSASVPMSGPRPAGAGMSMEANVDGPRARGTSDSARSRFSSGASSGSTAAALADVAAVATSLPPDVAAGINPAALAAIDASVRAEEEAYARDAAEAEASSGAQVDSASPLKEQRQRLRPGRKGKDRQQAPKPLAGPDQNVFSLDEEMSEDVREAWARTAANASRARAPPAPHAAPLRATNGGAHSAIPTISEEPETAGSTEAASLSSDLIASALEDVGESEFHADDEFVGSGHGRRRAHLDDVNEGAGERFGDAGSESTSPSGSDDDGGGGGASSPEEDLDVACSFIGGRHGSIEGWMRPRMAAAAGDEAAGAAGRDGRRPVHLSSSMPVAIPMAAFGRELRAAADTSVGRAAVGRRRDGPDAAALASSLQYQAWQGSAAGQRTLQLEAASGTDESDDGEDDLANETIPEEGESGSAEDEDASGDDARSAGSPRAPG